MENLDTIAFIVGRCLLGGVLIFFIIRALIKDRQKKQLKSN